MVYSSIRGAPADDGRQTQALGHKHAFKTWTIKTRRGTNFRKLCKRLSEKHSPPVAKYSFLASWVKLQPSWRPAEVWRCCRIFVMCSCSCDKAKTKKVFLFKPYSKPPVFNSPSVGLAHSPDANGPAISTLCRQTRSLCQWPQWECPYQIERNRSGASPSLALYSSASRWPWPHCV